MIFARKIFSGVFFSNGSKCPLPLVSYAYGAGKGKRGKLEQGRRLAKSLRPALQWPDQSASNVMSSPAKKTLIGLCEIFCLSP